MTMMTRSTTTIRIARSTARATLTYSNKNIYRSLSWPSIRRLGALPSTSTTSTPASLLSVVAHPHLSSRSSFSTTSHSRSEPSSEPSTLTENQYHEVADKYLEKLLAVLEAKAEAEEGFEVEYSAGVLSIVHKNGTYVINKQPPNKQIWLSSPVSGPKRYDWVAAPRSGQNEKEGTELFATGDDGRDGWWVYARDGGRLSTLLKREVGVDVNKED